MDRDYLSPFEQFLFEAGFCPFCRICLSRSMREACNECGARFSCSEDMQTEMEARGELTNRKGADHPGNHVAHTKQGGTKKRIRNGR